MRTVILIPYRSDGGRRDELAKFVEGWLKEHHSEWPVFKGVSPHGPFNRGAAINDAARAAGDWDVAVIHDADNIADPAMLRRAVLRAHEIKGCVYPFSTYTYLDKFSSDRLMTQQNWFVCSERRPGFDGVIPEHSSGVQCLSREAYDAIGGYVELTGWGKEDCATGVLIKTFVKAPIEHLDGGAFHLYHESATGDADAKHLHGPVNSVLLDELTRMEGNPARIAEFMPGHRIPGQPIKDVDIRPWMVMPISPRSDDTARRWTAFWHYLHRHPEIRFAFLLGPKVVKLNNPFRRMNYDTLYMASGSKTLRDVGGLEGMSRKKDLSRPLLDPNVVGGDRTTLLQFCSQMISLWDGHIYEDVSVEQARQDELYWANIVGHRHPALVTGPQVSTVHPCDTHPITWFSSTHE